MIIHLLLMLFVLTVKGAKEGESCTLNGVAGLCTNIRQCPAVIQGIKNKQKPQLCAFGGMDPIVCCVSSDTITDGTTELHDSDTSANRCEPIPASLTSNRTGQKAWDKCLEYQEKTVFPCAYHYNYHAIPPGSGWNGFSRSNGCHHDADVKSLESGAAEHNEFPHMALLLYGEDPGRLWRLCSGSLISDRHVLTAGRCIRTNVGDVAYVQLRAYRRTSAPVNNRYKVKRATKHPEYHAPQSYNDIAILELEIPVILDEHTVPACLHTGAPVDDSRALVTGWGLDAHTRNTSDPLQKKLLTKFLDDDCWNTLLPTRFDTKGYDEDTQFCFGHKDAPGDVCQYDFGSPLQIKNEQIACMYTIVGVATHNIRCTPGEPGIFTRVAFYKDWIESIVWP